MKQPEYTWDAEYGIATCTIFYNNKTFTGTANCHPEDTDVMSRLTGQIIAETRATISYLSHIRDNELRPQLNSLLQLYYSMNRSKNFNPKSYEAKMLYRQITLIKNDLEAIKEEITNIKQNLKDYINQKELSYKKIREVISKRDLAEYN